MKPRMPGGVYVLVVCCVEKVHGPLTSIGALRGLDNHMRLAGLRRPFGNRAQVSWCRSTLG